ncbi:Uncharacterized protein PBTT_02142 [Plasmodiophora brassicae]
MGMSSRLEVRGASYELHLTRLHTTTYRFIHLAMGPCAGERDRQDMQVSTSTASGSSAPLPDGSSEDFVRSMRLRFREQAARFLEDVSFDVGAVLARDASCQDEETRVRLAELQKGLTEQVQHMQTIIKKEKCTIAASNHKSKKDMHFTPNELKTLQDIANSEGDENGVVTTFLRRRQEGTARNRYKDFVKKAEQKYFEYRREGKKGKFNFRNIIQDSLAAPSTRPPPPSTSASKKAHAKPSHKTPKRSATPTQVPRLELPRHEGHSAMTSAVTTVATSSSALMTTSTLPSSTRSIYSARIPAPATSRPLMSGRQLVMEDPDVSTVRQIVQELSETVEVLVDFEWQPFQTAVPPPQYPYAFGEDAPAFVESMPDPITAHVEGVGEPDVTDDSNDEEGQEALTTIGEETGDDTETGTSYQQDANDEAFEEPRVEPDAPVVEAGSTEKTGYGSDELCGEYEPEPPSSVPEAGGCESVDPVDDDPVSTSYDTAVCGAKPVAESFDDESVPVIANDVSSQPSDEDNVAPPSDPETDVSNEAVQCLQEKPISAPVDLTDIGRIPKPKPGPLPALKSRKELSPVKLKPTKAHQQCHQRKLPERNSQVRRPTRKQAPPPKRADGDRDRSPWRHPDWHAHTRTSRANDLPTRAQRERLRSKALLAAKKGDEPSA